MPGAGDHTRLRRPEDWLPDGVATRLANRPSPPAPVPTVVEGAAPPLPVAQPTVPARPLYAPAGTFNAPYAAPPTPPPMPAPAPSPQPFVVIPRPPGSNRNAVVLISVLGGLFFLLAGCMAVLSNIDGKSSGDSADAAPRATSTAPRPDPKPVEYKGFNLPDNYDVSFADDQPVPRQNHGDLRYLCYSKICGFHSNSDAKLARLDSGTEGSLQACRQETRFTSEIPVAAISRGDGICVRTSQGTIALVVYRGRSAEDDPSTYATLDMTVWRGADRKD
ncbi:hypothetical protein WDV06_04560 [Streptomyces racemochromogenes]|uniref:Serine/threonine protein kinase n=1 Tax=Streptomyces racemochromogenes TaxID=67353 RepID=A0ABW7P7Q1_9ACTN